MNEFPFKSFPTIAAQVYEITGALNKQELVVFGSRPGNFGEQLFYEHMMAQSYYERLNILHYCQMAQSNLSELAPIINNKVESDKEIRTTQRDFVSLTELLSDCKVFNQDKKIDAVYINNFDMLDTSMKELRKNGIADMKSLAIYLDVSIVIFCRVNKDVDLRGGLRLPFPPDLHDRNQLEYVADKVYLSYNMEYYGFTEDTVGNPTEGMLRLYCYQSKVDKIDVNHIEKNATGRPLF